MVGAAPNGYAKRVNITSHCALFINIDPENTLIVMLNVTDAVITDTKLPDAKHVKLGSPGVTVTNGDVTAVYGDEPVYNPKTALGGDPVTKEAI